MNITFFKGWHGRLSPWGNNVNRGGASVDNAFQGVILPCHPVKNVIFILLYQTPPFSTLLQYYAVKLLNAPAAFFTHWDDVAKNPAMAAVGFSIWTVRAYISHTWYFFNVTLPTIALVKTMWHSKNVARSIDQSDHRKLTWGIIIYNYKCCTQVYKELDLDEFERMFSAYQRQMNWHEI